MTDLSKALSAPGMTGMAYDNADGILYLSTLSGELLRYNVRAETFLSPIELGGYLSSVALSPDGSFLLVGDEDVAADSHGNAYGTIDRVWLSNSAVDRLTVPVSNWSPGTLAGPSSVAIANNGQAYASNFDQGWQFTAASTNPSINAAQLPPHVSVSDQGRYLVETGNSLKILDTSTGKTAGPLSISGAPISWDVNDKTGQVALLVYANNLSIYDKNLKLVDNLYNIIPGGDFLAAVDFSIDGKFLYVLDATKDDVVIFNTNSWTKAGTIELPGGTLPPYQSEQMTVSGDGRFLFVQATSGVVDIDLSAHPTSITAAPVTPGATSFAKVATPLPGVGAFVPSTTQIKDAYVVASDQTLTFGTDHSPPFEFVWDPYGTTVPSLNDQGHVEVASSTPGATLAAVTDDGGILSSSAITVGSGGTLSVDATGAGSSAFGYASGGTSARVENDGTWSVSGVAVASGVFLAGTGFAGSGKYNFSNTGTFEVSGATARGVAAENSLTFFNSGQFTVTGTDAMGVDFGMFQGWGSFTNSGTFTVTGSSGNSIGIQLGGSYEFFSPFIITNSGTLTADTAIRVDDIVGPDESPLIHLDNSGTINGEIDLGLGYSVDFQPAGNQGSQVTNTGAINGAIRFDNGNTLYDGAKGTQTGGIYLGNGTDHVVLGDDGETVHGASGYGYIIGGAGNDIIDGGPGQTTFSYGKASVGVTVSLANPGPQVTGAGTDTLLNVNDLVGSTYDDTLTASGGHQSLEGGGGNDTMIAGSGNEVLDGGAGSDIVILPGSASGYTIAPTGDHYEAVGANGTYELYNDEFVRFTDEQMVLGSAGQTLTARDGGDTLVGGPGGDIFHVGAGTDTLNGGGGGDTAVFAGASSDYQLSLSNGVVTVTGAGGTATLTSVETLKFDDRSVNAATIGAVLTGTDSPNTLTGGNNDDTIYGLGGNDTLKGGAGNDLLDGGPGNDTLNGGAGTDTATYADATSGVTVSLQITTAQNTGGAGSDTLTAIENLIGSSFNDTLTAAAAGSVLQGMGGSDTLVSGAGNDTLDGGAGNDTASYALAAAAVTVSLAVSGPQNTHAGTDTLISIENLIGSKFNDTLTPGAGVESIDGGAGTDTVVYAGAAAAYVIGHSGAATTVTGAGQTDSLTNVEVLKFADEQLVITDAGAAVTARASGDTLVGGAGKDSLNGGGGNDVLVGNGGNDTLNGGAGTNTAIFHGVFSAYTVTAAKVTGPDGTDSLTKIQILQFDDRQVVDGSAATTLHARAGGDVLSVAQAVTS